MKRFPPTSVTFEKGQVFNSITNPESLSCRIICDAVYDSFFSITFFPPFVFPLFYKGMRIFTYKRLISLHIRCEK